jgi:tetratricopeptide (TPR) repeat protein
VDDVFRQYREALEKGHQAVIDGQPKQALAHYEEAARLAEARPLPHVCIGGVLLRTGHVAEATAAYDHALQLAPDDPGALAGKAAALSAAGRGEESTAVSEQLAALERRRIEQRREAEDAAAMRELERSGRLPRPEILYITGERAWLAGRHEAAVEAWLSSARGYAEAAHFDAAMDSCQRALLAAPGAPEVHLELARLYLQRGWSDRAAERLALLGRLLELEHDARLSKAVRELAAEYASRHHELAALAARSAGGR